MSAVPAVSSWLCKVTDGAVEIQFPDQRYRRGDKTFPSWALACLRDEDGNIKCGVREFSLHMNADGVAQVDTIELVDGLGKPLIGPHAPPHVNEDGLLAEARFSYILVGVSLAG